MKKRVVIDVNKFKPRFYQEPIWDAIENKGFKRVLAIMPRRAGKDITAFNLCIRECIRKPMVIFYIFPTYGQGRKVIWDNITNAGVRILDYIPNDLVENINSTEMKIRFKNGSLLQIVGSDNYDSLMGTNPKGVCFSEYSLQDERVYTYIRPILTANFGWALFLSTPRGHNHLWTLYNIAINSPQWCVFKLTVEDTQHISLEDIEQERADGTMSEDLIQQEYYTSFSLGIEGAYYTKYIDKMKLNHQIGQVPYELGFKVHTVWDIGVRDSTTIIFFQVIGQTVKIIDCYQNSKHGLEHYVNVINQRGYIYGRHIGPHDLRVQEFGSGISRIEKARQLGINFVIADNISIEDGIEAVRTCFSKVWIDEIKCAPLIKALENYRQEYDMKLRIYKSHPLHDWSSHFCFTGDTLILTRNGMRQIMLIEENDEILTLEGWQKCTKSQITRRNAQLVEVKFIDGTKVKCTPDHLFLTVNGWKSAESLTKHSEIRSSLMNLPNISMENCTDYMPRKNTLVTVLVDFIVMYGKMLLEIYQKIVIYIIKIIIHLTTIYGISNVFRQMSICVNQDLMQKDSQKKPEMQLLNGMDHRLVFYGTNGMQLEQKIGLNGLGNQGIVYIANKNIHVSLEKMDKNKNSVTQIVKPLIIESVKYLDYKEDVWDINVPFVGHFSLSNGAIVHNCDSMRYLAISLSKTRDGMTEEDMKSMAHAARYGEPNLPDFFRNGF